MADKGKSPTSTLIDSKTEDEMDQALTRFENAVNNFRADMENPRAHMDRRLDGIEMEFDSNFNALNSKFNYLLVLITALGGIVTLLRFVG